MSQEMIVQKGSTRRHRVLVHSSNPPNEASGYGTQMRVIVRALLAAHFDVIVLAHSAQPHPSQHLAAWDLDRFARMNQRVKTWVEAQDDCNTWLQHVTWCANWNTPCHVDKTALNQLLLENDVDLYVSFYDIFVNTSAACVVPAITLQPLHFYPLPHKEHVALGDFDIFLGISQFGRELMHQHFGGKHGPAVERHFELIAHSRPVRSVFTPLPEALDTTLGWESRLAAARAKIRASFGMPADAFVIVCAGSGSEHSDRKSFANQIEAMCRCAQQRDAEADAAGAPRPSTFMYLHTECLRVDRTGPFNDVPRFFEIFGELVDRPIDFASPLGMGHTAFDRTKPFEGPRFRVVAQASDADGFMSCTEERIRDMYRAADVVCHATSSEGCGVGMLEAQACGTPVVSTACTAMFELTELGISVAPACYKPRQDFNSGWAQVDVRGVTRALLDISRWTREERVQKTIKALKVIQREWSDERQAAQWTALVNTVRTDILCRLDEATRSETPPTSITIPPLRWLQLCAFKSLRGVYKAESAERLALVKGVELRTRARQRALEISGMLRGLHMAKSVSVSDPDSAAEQVLGQAV